MSDVAIAAPRVSAFLGQKPSKTRDAAVDSGARRKLLRKRLFAALGGLVIAAGAAYGGWWYIAGSHTVSTDDAYVDAEAAQITSRISGTLATVPVHDTLHVRRGDVLATIDPSDARLALAQSEANYGEAVRRVEQYFANTQSAAAQVVSKRADVVRAEDAYRRRVGLLSAGAVSADELTTARNAVDTAQAALEQAQHDLQSQHALIDGTDVAHNPEVLAAKAARDKAGLDLERTVIRAPIDGVVAQNGARIGQHIDPGNVLMSVVPVAQAYVDANFKESQLAHIHAGQPATLTSDLYGSHVVFHGHVVGLGGGTGSSMAVIPAQNATGNWIKVVQRLPVRIALDPQELAVHPLRVGLSMDAAIDASE
ncbi:MAG TPA: HlyD family secretion protein [Rhizomicrobium sp.]|jgi:membrane fusion protein (multidrug efflux system)